MRKIIKSLILAGLVSVSTLAKAEETPKIQKPAVVVTRVQNEGAEPINRIEITGKLPYNFEYYGTAEEQGSVDFYKARLQCVPLTYQNFSLGATIQHKNSNMFSEKNDWGLVTRIQGKPTKTTFGKLDLRYFPDKETIDWYGFIDSKRLFLDCLGDYNVEKGTGSIRPGIDFKCGYSFSVGLEGKFAGEPSDLDTKYIGARLKLRF
jgi:hypothetical protein